MRVRFAGPQAPSGVSTKSGWLELLRLREKAKHTLAVDWWISSLRTGGQQ
jgi:hypothetical protein